MRLFIKVVIITLIVIIGIVSLPKVLKQRAFTVYSDEGLRAEALGRGMYSIPKTYEGLLKVVDTKENPLTLEKIALGKELFFDPTLSKHNDISCATCHIIKKNTHEKSQTLIKTITSKDTKNSNCIACHLEEQSGTDRLSSSLGHKGAQSQYLLNTMTILNSALAPNLTWTGDIKSIEEQVGNSIQDAHKMALPKEEALLRLYDNTTYIKAFKDVFNLSSKEDITFEHLKKAIAAYSKTLLTRGSYDRFLDGDNDAINEKAKRGLSNFINFGCKGCHTGMSVGGQNLQKFPLRSFATVYDLRVNITFTPEFKIVDTSFPFENKGGFLGQDITNKFRVPILRNITKTSPYFHNGAVAKIHEAVEIMAKNQLGLNLSNQQIDEIVEFLKTLEGDIVDYTKGETHEND